MAKQNKSMNQTEKEGKCTSCAMNSVCTSQEKVRRTITSNCPSSVKHLPPIKTPTESGLEDMGFTVSETQEPADMIPVIKMEYWDGSKFIIRTDKAGYKKIIAKLRVKMRSRLLDLPEKKQIEIAQSGGMLKRTEEMMSEQEYLKITKYKGQR